MPDWNFLLDETALASVFPGDYARFVRPIREGLIVFLEGLPKSHQEEILRRQVSLPLTAGISQRLGLLAQCCPVLHKLGQTLARDQRLAPELRHYLRELESLPPSASDESIAAELSRELGPLEKLGLSLTPPAIAEASVAVVIPFARNKSDGGHKNGVFKLLKPGIEERLQLELELLGKVGSHLDERCHELKIPQLDYQDSFDQIREKLQHEVRLDQEQIHLAKAADFFADDPHVHIPAVFEYCTPRVTAMERLTGGKITNHSLYIQHEKRSLAERLVRALISRPIFHSAADALFHGDPHAGNILLTDEDRLGILDWSLVGTLGHGDRVAIVQIILGAITLDASRIIAVLESLSERGPPDPQILAAVVQSWLGQIRDGNLPGLSWLIGLLDDGVQRARLRASADLMLFRKSLHSLHGVVAEIGATGFNIDDVILVDFLSHFAAEWPWRWATSGDSREFATRLSNSDILQAFLSYPATLARFWSGRSVDLLDSYHTSCKVL